MVTPRPARSPEATPALQFSQAEQLTELERRLNLGIVFLVCLVAFYAIAWNRGIALLHALWAIMIVSFLASLIAPWVMLRPVRLRVRLPPTATVGDTIQVRIEAEDMGWPVRRRLVTLDHLLPFTQTPDIFLPQLRSHSEMRGQVLCVRRGVFKPGDVPARTAYPLGILQIRRTWSVHGETIAVAPRTWPVRRLELLQGHVSFGTDSDRHSSSRGQDIFRDTRDYRQGDNPRHMHWRSSARHDRLIVRQFESISTSETILVLNTNPGVHAGEGARRSFEMAIELAATIARALTQAGVRCGLAAGQGGADAGPCWIAPESGPAQWRKLDHALTRLTEDGVDVPYALQLQALQAHFRAGQRWILFDHEVRPSSLPGFLVKSRLPPTIFRFDTASFAAAAESPDPTLMRPAKMNNGWIIAGDTDLSQVFR